MESPEPHPLSVFQVLLKLFWFKCKNNSILSALLSRSLTVEIHPLGRGCRRSCGPFVKVLRHKEIEEAVVQLLLASLLLEKPRELVCTSPGHSVLTAGERRPHGETFSKANNRNVYHSHCEINPWYSGADSFPGHYKEEIKHWNIEGVGKVKAPEHSNSTGQRYLPKRRQKTFKGPNIHTQRYMYLCVCAWERAFTCMIYILVI